MSRSLARHLRRSGASPSPVQPCTCRRMIPAPPNGWRTGDWPRLEKGCFPTRRRETLDFLQLLQAANHRRHWRIRKAGLPVGDADFADIDGALRIQRDAVRREKFAGLKAGTILAAEPRDALSFGIDDAQARSQIRRFQVDRHAGA